MEQDEQDLFQFCSSEDDGVQTIAATFEVCRMWLGQLHNGKPQEAAEGQKMAKKRRRNEMGFEDDEAEDYFLFHSRPAKTTRASLAQLPSEVLHRAFNATEGDALGENRNPAFAEHRRLRYQRLTHSFEKWMLQLQYRGAHLDGSCLLTLELCADLFLISLRNGFNLVLYGFGSKYNLLQEFAKSTLSAFPVLTIEGYTPTTTIRNVRGDPSAALD